MESSNPVVEVAKTTSCCSGTNSSGPVVSTLPEQVTNVEAVVNGASTDMPDKASTTDESSLPASNCNSAHATNTAQTLPQSNPAMPKVTAQPTTATEPSVKSRSSREEKSRKKDDKSVDHVLRALNSLSTTEEKLAAMCKKYADFFDEHRKLQALQKQTEKRCSLLQREKEQLQAEHSKAILTRSRLENLCRELQRQNKAIKDESLLKVREEEEKRKEVSAKFQTTMNEITTLMQQNNDKNMKLRDDNIDMTSKLKNICEQYELRQQQVERISKQMQLEQQLSEAKLSKLKLEMAAERELLLKEKQQLLLELQQYQQRCTEFQATEMSLRNQISLYNDKYDEFQKALARSNDVFGGFKGEMEKMSKKICKLEKETSSWKQRWERSHNALLEMAADKQKSEQELAMVSRQLVTLQSLCRTLQTERSSLLSKLKLLQGVGSESQGKCIMNSPDICNKQCSQALNLTESLNVAEKPTSEGDQTLNHCPHNLQSSLEGSETVGSPLRNDVIDSTEAVANNIETLVPKPEVSDVVGTSNVCDLVVNNVLVERLENINITPNMQLTVDSCSSNQPLSVPIVGEINKLSSDSGADQTVFNAENPPADTPSVPVLNGDTLLNGSCPTDKNDAENLNNQQAEKPLVSHSSNESESKPVGKKSKETKKKKK